MSSTFDILCYIIKNQLLESSIISILIPLNAFATSLLKVFT